VTNGFRSPRDATSGFVTDENGQATAEYIFAILIVLSVAVLVVRDFLRPIITAVGDYVENRLGANLFTDFHRYRP